MARIRAQLRLAWRETSHAFLTSAPAFSAHLRGSGSFRPETHTASGKLLREVGLSHDVIFKPGTVVSESRNGPPVAEVAIAGPPPATAVQEADQLISD